jgi:hypothetical protein
MQIRIRDSEIFLALDPGWKKFGSDPIRNTAYYSTWNFKYCSSPTVSDYLYVCGLGAGERAETRDADGGDEP